MFKQETLRKWEILIDNNWQPVLLGQLDVGDIIRYQDPIHSDTWSSPLKLVTRPTFDADWVNIDKETL